jgi:hypothetical protein
MLQEKKKKKEKKTKKKEKKKEKKKIPLFSPSSPTPHHWKFNEHFLLAWQN